MLEKDMIERTTRVTFLSLRSVFSQCILIMEEEERERVSSWCECVCVCVKKSRDQKWKLSSVELRRVCEKQIPGSKMETT